MPQWAHKAQQWITPEEWEEFQQQLKQRQTLQQKIKEQDNQAKKNSNK